MNIITKTRATFQYVAVSLCLFLFTGSALATENSELKTWHEKVSDTAFNAVFFDVPIPFTESTTAPFVLVLLAITALFTTIFFGFINIRGIGKSIRTIKGKYSNDDDPGEITHFQALAAALSATVGLGNIAGVAIAISIGGPGATFWMIVCGLLGMTTKFCECTLGVKYREIDENGKVHGGGMYYLSKGLGELGMPMVGKILAVLFAVACVVSTWGGGNMFQGNQAFAQTVLVTGGEDSWLYGKGWVFGVILAGFVGAVIIGGIKSIGMVASKLVPLMCGIYVICALYIILAHFGDIPEALSSIINGAFSPEAGLGGVIGVLIQGVKRASFSNEAGFGSAPIAHSAVKTRKPASEGYVALLGPFIDTVVICTMTALVIIITGFKTSAEASGAEAIGVTSEAFGSVISFFPYVLFVSVILFAFSTMISWSYYGQTAWAYLFGRSKKLEIVYKLIFCGFIVLGTSIELKSVLKFSDAMMFTMVFPNLIGIYFLLPKIKEEVKIYDDHMNEIDSRSKE